MMENSLLFVSGILCLLICLAHLDCISPPPVMDHSLMVDCLLSSLGQQCVFVEFWPGVNWACFCLFRMIVIAVHCQFLFHGEKFTPVNRGFELVKILLRFSTIINLVALKMRNKLFSIFSMYIVVKNISSLPNQCWSLEWLASFPHLLRNLFCACLPWTKSRGYVVLVPNTHMPKYFFPKILRNIGI